MRRMAAFVAREAAAYVRSGLLAPSLGRSIPQNASERRSFGVVFVPGVGANASQFVAIKAALASQVDWFDTFEYWSAVHPARVTARLHHHLEVAGRRCGRILAIGHSLGGLLLRAALQTEPAPGSVAGYVAICSPLHGTWRSKLAPTPALRALTPDSAWMGEVLRGAERLRRLRGAILTVASTGDHFVSPAESALLGGEAQLVLEDVGHVGALFDPRVHTAIRQLAAQVAGVAPRASPL